MRRDLVCAALGLALAVAYYAASNALPRSLLADGVGADGVPKLLAVVLAVLSVVIGVRGFLTPSLTLPLPGGGRHLRALGVAALGAAFVVLAPVLGYPLAVALLLLAAALYYGAAPRLQVVLYAGGTAAILWLVFARVLGVAMPVGFFG
ncbi:MAG TPA: tripartite tricarboxylate transporter TctB family protein [Burkholderiales bacterium]|nr:tripartite tricarboxylate transporter TctB family protein [Burkholderiales bacterium]